MASRLSHGMPGASPMLTSSQVGSNIAGVYLHDGFSGGIDLVSVGVADSGK